MLYSNWCNHMIWLYSIFVIFAIKWQTMLNAHHTHSCTEPASQKRDLRRWMFVRACDISNSTWISLALAYGHTHFVWWCVLFCFCLHCPLILYLNINFNFMCRFFLLFSVSLSLSPKFIRFIWICVHFCFCLSSLFVFALAEIVLYASSIY